MLANGRRVNACLTLAVACDGASIQTVEALAGAGGFVRADLAQYRAATCADVPSVEAYRIEEDDPHRWPGGGKGIGEIGITGTAAAIRNAVYHATGRRVRDLPVTPAKLLRPA